MRSEAQQLGEADILPELEAVEERLQVGTASCQQLNLLSAGFARGDRPGGREGGLGNG